MIKHLLVPIDGSEPAHRAIAYAVELAAQTGSRLTFCTALDRDALVADAAAAEALDIEAVLAENRRAARELLDGAKKAAAARGVPCDTRVDEGQVVDVILTVERELAPDILVMGTHGRRGLGRLFLGSTTEGVLRRSAVPVLAVPTVHVEAGAAPVATTAR